MNPKIQDKYNINPRTSLVDYSDMLLLLTKIFRVKTNAVVSEIGTVEKYEGIT